MILEYALTHPTANDPERANPSDAGLDVFYSPENENQAIAIEPGASKVIPTGLRFGVPHGYMLEVKNRSSVAQLVLIPVVHFRAFRSRSSNLYRQSITISDRGDGALGSTDE